MCRFMAVRTGDSNEELVVEVEGTRRRGRRRCLDIIIGTMERDKICLEDGVWKM